MTYEEDDIHNDDPQFPLDHIIRRGPLHIAFILGESGREREEEDRGEDEGGGEGETAGGRCLTRGCRG